MRYIVGSLIAVGLVFIFIIILARVIFGGGGDQTEQVKQASLSDYKDTEVIVRMIAAGPIVADQDFKQVRIDIGRDANTLDIIDGYRGDVSKHENVPSNPIAYGNFLSAVEQYGLGSGKNDDSDYSGACPTGSRYVYQIVRGSKVEKQYWTTSCGGEGTFQGQYDMVNQLFQQQIPNYQEITSGLNI